MPVKCHVPDLGDFFEQAVNLLKTILVEKRAFDTRMKLLGGSSRVKNAQYKQSLRSAKDNSNRTNLIALVSTHAPLASNGQVNQPSCTTRTTSRHMRSWTSGIGPRLGRKTLLLGVWRNRGGSLATRCRRGGNRENPTDPDYLCMRKRRVRGQRRTIYAIRGKSG